MRRTETYLSSAYCVPLFLCSILKTTDFWRLSQSSSDSSLNTQRSFPSGCVSKTISPPYRSRKEERVYISMPEFRCSFGDNLSDICQRLGIKTVFTEYADFSPLAKEQLMLGEILHKAYIEVDRKGTRAAAATRGEVLFTGVPSFDYAKLDRPFVYAVVHRKTGLPVFVGLTNRCEELR